MLGKVTNLIDTKAVLALGLMTSIVGLGTIMGNAQGTSDTTVNLSIAAGVATIYAGDATDNNDICTPADDATTIETIACSVAERSVTLSAANVLNTRQESTSVVHDILIDDLRGLTSAQYTIDVTMCDLGGDLDNGGTYDDITYPLGYTGDGNAALYARTDADSNGAIEALKPTTTVTAYTGGENLNWSKGANTQVTDTTTPISVYSTSVGVTPGRYDIDAVDIGFELPAYIEVGSYQCAMTYTLTV